MHDSALTVRLEERGFTLVELVLVIVVVSILAFAAMSRLPSGGLSLAGEADQLAGDIRYAQALSMTRGERFCINFAAGSYQITHTGCGIAVPNPATGETTVNLRANIIVTGLPNGYVQFDGRGRPVQDAAANTLLVADAELRLGVDGDSRKVVVTPDTGRVRVQ